jgi:undecaprenyl pyrophosphate synthase
MDDDGLLYRVYEKRLSRELANYQLPQHLGVIVDGNRRWARAAGITTAEGHRQGGARITEFLTWCEDLGIPLVTVWLLSTDNMNRSAEELDDLVEIIAETVEQIADAGFPVRLAGNMGDIPAVTRERIRRVEQRALLEGSGSRAARAAKSSVNSAAKSPVKVSAKGQARGGKTADEARDLTVNVAIGYGGREEIVEASRERDRSGEDRRGHHRGVHRRPPLHAGSTGSRPHHPHLGGAAAVGVPAVAVRAFGVLVLRHQLAGLPPGGPAAGPARLLPPRAPVRGLTGMVGAAPIVVGPGVVGLGVVVADGAARASAGQQPGVGPVTARCHVPVNDGPAARPSHISTRHRGSVPTSAPADRRAPRIGAVR